MQPRWGEGAAYDSLSELPTTSSEPATIGFSPGILQVDFGWISGIRRQRTPARAAACVGSQRGARFHSDSWTSRNALSAEHLLGAYRNHERCRNAHPFPTARYYRVYSIMCKGRFLIILGRFHITSSISIRNIQFSLNSFSPTRATRLTSASQLS